MNERIKELAEQAGYKPLSPPTFADELNEIFMRKFAELIRQDEREACAEICDWISEHYETRTDLNKTQKQVGQLAAEVCGVRIRERGER